MRKYRLRWDNLALTQRVVRLLCEPQVTSAEGTWGGGRMTKGVVRGSRLGFPAPCRCRRGRKSDGLPLVAWGTWYTEGSFWRSLAKESKRMPVQLNVNFRHVLTMIDTPC